jgi:hypothetical protein
LSAQRNVVQPGLPGQVPPQRSGIPHVDHRAEPDVCAEL